MLGSEADCLTINVLELERLESDGVSVISLVPLHLVCMEAFHCLIFNEVIFYSAKTRKKVMECLFWKEKKIEN